MAEKMVPGSHNWLEVVVDSVKSGSKNGSSLPVLRGTMPGQIINWRGVVADLCHWEASLVSCWAMEEMSCAVGWRRMHGRLTSAKPFLWDPSMAVPAARLARPCWHDLRMVFTARPWPWTTTTLTRRICTS